MDSLVSLTRATLPSFLVPFVTLSHQVSPPEHTDSFPNSSYHDIGRLDVCLIVTLIAAMAVARDATRLFVLEPFARWKLMRDWRRYKTQKSSNTSGASTPTTAKASPIDGAPLNGNGYLAEKSNAERLLEKTTEPRHIKHGVMRFAEQGWVFVYYLAQWSYGLYIYSNLPSDSWTGYPHIPLAAPVKLYYLWEIAFYCHSVLTLNAEARRKDHWQMFTHHVITIALMILSYAYNFTRVGCFIMFIMDSCDLILPFAKMLRYLGYQTACDIAFVVFMLTWLYTRHYLFILVILSTYLQAPKAIAFDWQPERGHYFTSEVHIGFLALMIPLEILQIIWCFLIFSMAWRVVTGQGADDPRSDDEA
ncbi:longevity assurance proteins LAG1/LAC1 [Vararia minispora EC-137]|uniref:Longevity assurance proteins LAG1/LAC1 n=1 Tax=Vararia minispora EC-137 TaxID=1314806 RepID=A0ACB8Q5B6_9AGAM|nr:longevity assurance proteins LAG1/LAC1 [Vararia minispora EC-137]